MKQTIIELLGHTSIWGLIFLCAGCRSEKKELGINFLLNEQDYPAVTEIHDPQDSKTTYLLTQGDTVYFKDISTSKKNGTRRYWDLDGAEGWEAQDVKFTQFSYERPGPYLVSLCVGELSQCVKKSIFVRERTDNGPIKTEAPKQTATKEPSKPKTQPVPQKPTLRFTLPNVYSTNTDEAVFNIVVKISHVEGKEDLALRINGQDTRNFSYSKSKRELRAGIPLLDGKNIVVVTAQTAMGTATAEAEFVKK